MITVALPVYKRKPIAWVALESLSKQMTSQPWELIVCEEIHDGQCGRDYFFDYSDRLGQAGCKNIQYIELSAWVNLPEKYRIMAQQANGELFLLQASDSWSDPGRLERTWKTLQEYDWTNDTKTHFFEIGTGRMIMFDLSLHKAKANAVGIACGMKTEIIRTLPQSDYVSGIDGFMYQHFHEQGAKFCKETRLFKNLEFQGINNIIAHRSIFYDDVKHPYCSAQLTAADILPGDVIERLKDIRPVNELNMSKKIRLLRDWQSHRRGDEISLTGPVISYLVKKQIAEYIHPEVTITQREYEQLKAKQNESKIPERPQRSKGGGKGGSNPRGGKVLRQKANS